MIYSLFSILPLSKRTRWVLTWTRGKFIDHCPRLSHLVPLPSGSDDGEIILLPSFRGLFTMKPSVTVKCTTRAWIEVVVTLTAHVLPSILTIFRRRRDYCFESWNRGHLLQYGSCKSFNLCVSRWTFVDENVEKLYQQPHYSVYDTDEEWLRVLTASFGSWTGEKETGLLQVVSEKPSDSPERLRLEVLVLSLRSTPFLLGCKAPCSSLMSLFSAGNWGN